MPDMLVNLLKLAPLEPVVIKSARLVSPYNREKIAALSKAVGKGFDPILLDGVTGSGKTEVYFEAIAECLRQGKQALRMRRNLLRAA